MSDDGFSPYDLPRVSDARRNSPAERRGLYDVTPGHYGPGTAGLAQHDALPDITIPPVRVEQRAMIAPEELDALRAENARLKAELAEKRETIDTLAACMRRACTLWMEQHPGTNLYPDGAVAIVWLKEQVDALTVRRCETCRHLLRWSKWDSCCMWGMVVPVETALRGCNDWQPKEAADA